MSPDALRTGLDPDFLGAEVPLPRPVDPALPTVLLDYVHFSVLLRPDRRLAAVTGVGIDGAALLDLDRSGIDWRLDPRVPADQQAGPELYAGNDLDRGHLVRRADAVWGPRAEAQAANVDTFHYTNAAPQAALFNQGDQLWLGLETYLLEYAATYDRRLVVFTGPVLADDDPLYRDVQIPLRFFKVAVFVTADGLAATGYLLDQGPQVDDVLEAAADEPPPLGPFRTFQAPIADLADLTGLDLAQAAALDRYGVVAAEEGADRWTRLLTYDDISL